MAKGVKGFIKGHKHSEDTKAKISIANSKKVSVLCDNCGIESKIRPSHLARKRRHFCSMSCYAKNRLIWDKKDQPTWRGGVDPLIASANWRKRNREKTRHYKLIYYARKKNAEGTYSISDWKSIQEKHDFKCAICKERKILTRDHIIPLSKGGSNWPSNIQPLCRSCNSRKNNHIHENPELLTQLEKK